MVCATRCAECGGAIADDAPEYRAHRWRRLGGDGPAREELLVCSLACLAAREAANARVRIGPDETDEPHGNAEPDAPKRCQNCQLETRRTARLVTVTPSGRQLYLSVCRDCYLHLGGRKSP
jgi:hypothetical protein